MTKSRSPTVLAFVLAAGVVAPAVARGQAVAPIPEVVPPGWTLQTSTNSIYFQRADIPDVRVGFVNDLRTGMSPTEKFEAAKAFFAESADCPDLATAETIENFGSDTAFDHAETPRCFLIAMGHWRDGGLQMALILKNARTLEAGPRPGDDVFDAIVQDIFQYAMLRYEIGDQDVTPDIPAEYHARSVAPDDGPTVILRSVAADSSYHRAMASFDIVDGVNARRDGDLLPVLLFGPGGNDPRLRGSLCSDWDPGFFSPRSIQRYHARNDCFPFEWRWVNGEEGGPIEARTGASDWMPLDEHVRDERDGEFVIGEPYQKIYRGATFDVRLGHNPLALAAVANGEAPITELAPNEAILTSDGRIVLGHLEAASLPDPEPGTFRPVRGTYYFAGHLVTIKLEDGHVVRGFTGWLPREDETELGTRSTLMINGVHYFGR